MAEEELATKSPENDAQESLIPGDTVAQEGASMGDHYPNADPETNPSLIEKVKLGVAETAKSFRIDMWLARQTPEKVLPILNKVIEGAKEEFADAVANGGGIYAAGYCFGGKYVLLLGSELSDAVAKGQSLKDEEQGQVKTGPQIKAGAIAHGTLVTKEDIEGVKIPITMACTEGQKYLVDHEIPHDIQVFPGVPHGFAVVGEYEDSKIKDAQKTAFEQMVSWLKSH
ncbi:MAG: hypothetical protein LQ351_000705 [Letrouitia transgressa]|nr:MAG: hypothetical protein LQ351_000705 [Letrouitia transgressa]